MKQIFVAIMLALASCQSNTDKVQTAVADYIRKTTTRPDSYEPGTFQIHQADAQHWKVRHKYRAFDGVGSMETVDAFFEVDAAGKVEEISAADY